MRVLVTRPEAEAKRTAQALRALGHEPILLPMSAIIATPFTLPQDGFAAIAATSANAFGAFRTEAAHVHLPVFAVGEKTALAARNAGFAYVHVGSGTATALAGQMIRALGPNASIVFLAGSPRKPHLEMALRQSGLRVTTIEAYRSTPVARQTASAPVVDAVLHYSRVSAQRFADFARTNALPGSPVHLCLSADVAQGLINLPDARIFIADKPDEPSIFALLNTCCSGPAV